MDRPHPSTGEDPPHVDPTILVVDDDPLLSGLLEACLELEGARVVPVHLLAEARELLSPSLSHIVLDRRMPDGDGLELLDDIDAVCPDVPVVVYSALDDGAEPPDVNRVDKSDLGGLAGLLGVDQARPDHG